MSKLTIGPDSLLYLAAAPSTLSVSTELGLGGKLMFLSEKFQASFSGFILSLYIHPKPTSGATADSA